MLTQARPAAAVQRFLFQGKPAWDDASADVLNGYGGQVDSFFTIGDAEAHTRWRVMR